MFLSILEKEANTIGTNSGNVDGTIPKSSLTCYIFPRDFLCNPREIKDPRKNILMKSKNGQVSLYSLLISSSRGCI